MASAPRILIAGCGAIGSIFACLLRQTGYDVTILGRAFHLDAIAVRGLRLNGIWGDHFATDFNVATTAAEIAGTFGLVLIAVKSYDTQSMVDTVAPLITADGIAISLQNGLGNVEILARLRSGKKPRRQRSRRRDDA